MKPNSPDSHLKGNICLVVTMFSNCGFTNTFAQRLLYPPPHYIQVVDPGFPTRGFQYIPALKSPLNRAVHNLSVAAGVSLNNFSEQRKVNSLRK